MTKEEDIARASVGMARIWEECASLPDASRASRLLHLGAQALSSIVSTPVLSLIAVLTIALALFLLAAFLMFIQNIGAALSASKSEFALSIYLRDGVSSEQIEVIKKRLNEFREIEEVRYVDKAAALKAFRESLGRQEDLLEGLGNQNPLPASLEVRLGEHTELQPTLEKIARAFSADAAVDQVEYNSGLAGQLASLLSLFRSGAVLSVLLMVVIVSFIISNTIKLALYSRGEELEIMHLVGASRAAIRAPCLIEGVLQGIVGALLGLAALYAVCALLGRAIAQSSALQLFLPAIHFLSWPSQIFVLAIGVFVGIAGSYLAVRPFLVVR